MNSDLSEFFAQLMVLLHSLKLKLDCWLYSTVSVWNWLSKKPLSNHQGSTVQPLGTLASTDRSAIRLPRGHLGFAENIDEDACINTFTCWYRHSHFITVIIITINMGPVKSFFKIASVVASQILIYFASSNAKPNTAAFENPITFADPFEVVRPGPGV